MSLFPTTQQWKRWSLPSKLTAIGVLIGVLTLIIYGIEKILPYFKSATSVSYSLEKDFPVKFGDSREVVRKKLGPPQESVTAWETFYSDGISIFYDRHTHRVNGFYVHNLLSATNFTGTVLGIKIGDSFDHVKEMHGKPDSWGLPNKTPLAVWQKKGRFFVILLNSTESQKAGCVRGIIYCDQNSFANYIAIIATSIQEIRAGRVPTMLEYGITPFISVDMNDSYFLQPYVIILAKLSPHGGAHFILEFKNFKRVICWIYPLGWKNPRIRVLASLDSNWDPIYNLPSDANLKTPSPEIDALLDAIEQVESGNDYFKERDEIIDIGYQ